MAVLRSTNESAKIFLNILYRDESEWVMAVVGFEGLKGQGKR